MSTKPTKVTGRTAEADAVADPVAKPATPADVGTELLGLLGRATEADLVKFNERIEVLEAELSTVREVRRLVAGRLGVLLRPAMNSKAKAAPAATQRAPTPGTDRPNGPVRRGVAGTIEKKIAQALKDGPLDADTAIARSGVTAAEFYRTVSRDWFSKDGLRYALTPLGRQEALDE